MNHRLQQFLSAENISQAQFADSIDVARASVSHVLAGRNKPGYDFIKSISDHYPKLNIEWLITGKGKMYKQESPFWAPEPQVKVEQTPATLFSDSYFGEEMQSTIPEKEAVPAKNETAPAPLEKAPAAAPAGRAITRIIVFYDDNTFQELK